MWRLYECFVRSSVLVVIHKMTRCMRGISGIFLSVCDNVNRRTWRPSLHMVLAHGTDDGGGCRGGSARQQPPPGVPLQPPPVGALPGRARTVQQRSSRWRPPPDGAAASLPSRRRGRAIRRSSRWAPHQGPAPPPSPSLGDASASGHATRGRSTLRCGRAQPVSVRFDGMRVIRPTNLQRCGHALVPAGAGGGAVRAAVGMQASVPFSRLLKLNRPELP